MSSDRPVCVAAFDVDGTLTTRDCVVPFLRRCASGPAAVRGVLSQAPRAMLAIARRDRDTLKAAASRAVFAGRAAADVEREAERFARLVVAERLRPDTLARLRWHLAEGHRTVLVSASYAVYLEHIAEALGVEAVLGTQLEIDEHGRCTGDLIDGNCRADEKRRQLSAWLAAEGLERERIVIWAYGDSSGDDELLAFADHPVWAADPLASVAPTV